MNKFLTSIIIFTSVCISAFAYQPSTVPNPRQTEAWSYVANPDGILSPKAEQQINQIANNIYQQTEAELCVVVLNDIEGYAAADFAQELFNRWGIGKKGKNTGVMILLVTESRDIRIHTGGGMEGLLPDAVCEEIIDVDMIEYLQYNNWDDGMIAGANGISKRLLTDAAKAELLLGYTPKDTIIADLFFAYIIICCVVLIILSLLVYRDTNWNPQASKEERLKHASNTWSICFLCAFIFPIPVALLTLWFYRHGGKEIQAILRAARIAASSSNGGGVFISGGRSHRGGGFGGGFGGGSFGGGMSFGGGAGHKF